MIDFSSPLAKEFFETGKCVSCPVIDMHAHMFNLLGAYMIAKKPEDVIRAMDRSGVKTTVFCSHSALWGGPEYYADDLAVAKQYKDRFKLYYPVMSTRLDPARDLSAVDANPDEYVGFKFLCSYYKTPLSSEGHVPYFSYANERKMPVLCHTWGANAYNGEVEVEKILERYDGLSFIAGHSIRGSWDEAIRLAKKYKNLYLELTAVLTNRGIVDRFVSEGLSKQILFGVDAPWFSYDFGIGALLDANITDEDRKDILYRNAERVLSLPSSVK